MLKRHLALLLLVSLPQFSLAQENSIESLIEDSTWKIQGFGTIGGAYQENKEIGFRSDTRADKSSQGNFSFATDTKLGLQLDADFNNNFSVTVQGLAEQWDSDGGVARIEWANIKYDFTNELSLRVGRMRASTFMYSDIQNVSYAYNWVRLPQEIYSTLPFRGYEGAELNYVKQINDYTFNSKLFYGCGEDKIVTAPESDPSVVKLNEFKGVVLGLTAEDFKIRVSYSQAYMTFENTRVDSFFDRSLPPQAQETFNNLRHKYQIDKKLVEFYSLGASYDYENFSIVGEYIQLQNQSMMPNTTAAYISLAYQIDTFTPYVTVAQSDRESNYDNDLYVANPGADPILNMYNGLNSGFQQIVKELSYAQKSKSVGLRYDFLDNAAAKIQYDYIEVDENHINMHFHFDDKLEDMHVFSATIDFVF